MRINFRIALLQREFAQYCLDLLLMLFCLLRKSYGFAEFASKSRND